jgi:hypothetical protein
MTDGRSRWERAGKRRAPCCLRWAHGQSAQCAETAAQRPANRLTATGWPKHALASSVVSTSPTAPAASTH